MGGAVAYNRGEVDILVLDRERRPVVVVEVKAGSRQRPGDIQSYLEILRSYAAQSGAQFMMLVTSSKIMIWRLDKGTDKPLEELDTPEILRTYEIFGGTTTVSHLALEIAAKQWLQDLILHWHSAEPPFQGNMQQIGVLDAIRNGEVVIEARL